MMASPRRSWLESTVFFAVFFGAFYAYLWLCVDTALLTVDPTLLPEDAGLVPFPGFSCSLLALSESLAHPGGTVECLSALLSETYRYPWAGALVITMTAALLTMTTHVAIAGVAGRPPGVMHFAPAILVLALYGQYADKLHMLLGVLLALLAVRVYVQARSVAPALRLIIFLALSALVYHAAAGACLLYAALCAVFELRSRRGAILGLCYLLLGAATPYALGTCILDLILSDAYMHLSPWPPGADPTGQTIMLGIYVAVVLSAAGAAAWRRAAARRRGGAAGSPDTAGSTSEAQPSRMGAISARLRKLMAAPVFGFAVVLLAAACVAFALFDGPTRALRRINYYAAEEMWPQLLQEAKALRGGRYTFAAMHAANRALYETGQLPYEMFCYPQHPKGILVGVLAGSWPTEYFHEGRRKQFFEVGDIELQIGLVNEAEHEAYEALEIFPDHPVVLKRLALIHIVKEQPEVAQVLLRALSRYIGYRRWAQDALRRLEADPLWSTDPEVQHLRAIMVRRRSAILDLTVDQRVDELLRTNRHNRMAFEYAMAQCLICCRFKELIRGLSRLDDFSYPGIPRHYEEAILIYEDMTGKKVDLHGREISRETQQVFREFRSGLVALRQAQDRQAHWEALEARFGDTYFSYNAGIAIQGSGG